MKKSFQAILIIVVILLFAGLFAACNNKVDPQKNDGPNEYEVVTYKVTYASSGEESVSGYNLPAVEAGSILTAPQKNGQAFIPTKVGYNFAYWSADGSTAFDFANTPVNSDLTLTAVFLPKTYTHTTVLSARLMQEEVGGKTTYRIQENAYSNYEEFTAALSSTYGASQGAELAIPESSDALDRFMFWYYMDKEGNPVQFSSQAALNATSVTQLSRYNFITGLTLYAMWYSQLPKVTVVYNDSLGEDEPYLTRDYARADYVPNGEAPDMEAVTAASPTKDGQYIFEKWYYLKTVDGVETKVDFVFDLTGEEDIPTSLVAAVGIADDSFKSGTLNLYASWKKLVSITNVADFEVKLYDVMHGDSSEAEKEATRKAIIKFGNNENLIDFGTREYAPLFDEDHKFVGEIDGGKYDNTTLTAKLKIVGGVFGDEKSASVFGNIAGGTIKNIDFENVGLKFAVPEQSGTDFLAGVIATSIGVAYDESGDVEKTGKISNCSVKYDSLTIDLDGSAVDGGVLKDGLAKVVFGGAVAKNSGSELVRITIRLADVDILAEGVVFGGLTGENSASGKIEEADVNVAITRVRTYDNGKSADGGPYAIVGGVVGKNNGLVTKAQVDMSCVAVDAKYGFAFGGVSAQNTGGITLTSADVTLATDGAKAVVGMTVNVGGLAGRNEGYVINSCVATDLHVQAEANGTASVGGIVGSNDSLGDSSTTETAHGTIKMSYATGAVDASVKTGTTATVYAGGLVGRNNKSSNFASIFAVVNVAVQNAGTSNLGKLFGSMEGNATIKAPANVLRAQTATLTLNGEAVDGLVVGSEADVVDFENAEFVIGTSSTLKFDATIWEINAGLPTLK